MEPPTTNHLPPKYFLSITQKMWAKLVNLFRMRRERKAKQYRDEYALFLYRNRI